MGSSEVTELMVIAAKDLNPFQIRTIGVLPQYTPGINRRKRVKQMVVKTPWFHAKSCHVEFFALRSAFTSIWIVRLGDESEYMDGLVNTGKRLVHQHNRERSHDVESCLVHH